MTTATIQLSSLSKEIPLLFLNSTQSAPNLTFQPQTDSAVNVRLQVKRGEEVLVDLDNYSPCYTGDEKTATALVLSKFLQKVLEANFTNGQ